MPFRIGYILGSYPLSLPLDLQISFECLLAHQENISLIFSRTNRQVKTSPSVIHTLIRNLDGHKHTYAIVNHYFYSCVIMLKVKLI